VPEPRRHFQSSARRAIPEGAALHGARAVVEAATTIYVTGEADPTPVHVAVLRVDGGRIFAKLDHPAHIGEPPEQVLAGQKVKLLVKDDGDHYFQLDRGGLGIGGLLDRVRQRITGPSAAPAVASPPAPDRDAGGEDL
jgi:hypothetical protein